MSKAFSHNVPISGNAQELVIFTKRETCEAPKIPNKGMDLEKAFDTVSLLTENIQGILFGTGIGLRKPSDSTYFLKGNTKGSM